MRVSFSLAALALLVSPLAAERMITTIAGPGRSSSFSGDGVPATMASVGQPVAVAVDAGGNFYFADYAGQAVRKVDRYGIMTTVAGSGLYLAEMHSSERRSVGDGGPAILASLWPTGVAVDRAGNVFISDSLHYSVRKVSPDGIISTVAGNGREAFSGDGKPAVEASLTNPTGLVVDSKGNLYIADGLRVRRVGPDGVITTFAGGADLMSSVLPTVGKPATGLKMYLNPSVALDSNDNVYISVSFNLVKVSPAGIITQVYGGGMSDADGIQNANASLSVKGLAVDASGNIFCSMYSSAIRMISTSGIISTIAGALQSGLSGDGGPAAAAKLNGPGALAADPAGSLYVADCGNGRIRFVSAGTAATYTVARTQLLFLGASGGPLSASETIELIGSRPDLAFSIAVSTPGDPPWLRVSPTTGFMPATLQVVADPAGLEPGDHTATITILAPQAAPNEQTVVVKFSVGDQQPGLTPSYTEGIITTWAGGGESFEFDIPAVSAKLEELSGMAIDSADNLYLSVHARILKVTPQGVLSLVAGTGWYGFSGDGGPARDAMLYLNAGLAIDRQDNLYVADRFNHRVRKISPDGIISTIAGNGAAATSGDGGPATEAGLNNPVAVAVDGAGNVYVADSFDRRVRRIGTDGIISTVVGNGSYGTDIVEGALATEGPIDRADGLAFDRDGILYVSGMGRIRKVLPDGRIFTVVGGNVLARDLEDGLCATRVSGYAPMAIDASNNLYFSSFSGSTSQVARIAPSAGRVSVVAGVGRDIHGASGDGVPARSAVFGSLVGLAVDSAGNLYISSGNRVRRVSAASPRSSP